MYNPSIPQASDFLSQSQKQFLKNNSEIARQFAFDHVPLDDPEDLDRGKHKKLVFKEQSSDQTTGATDYGMYTKDTSGSPEVYLRPESDGTPYKFTNGGLPSPGLKLRAAVLFDNQGNILKDKQNEPIAFNVNSITIPNPLSGGLNVQDDWIVNFESDIGTDAYFWVVNGFYGPPTNQIQSSLFTVTTPYLFGSYSDAIKSGSIRIMTKNINGQSTPTLLFTKIVQVQIYTVA